MTMVKDQAEFMALAGQTVGRMNREQAWRYANHVTEESIELRHACVNGDLVKAVDGAVDLIVVALGFLHSLGVDPAEAWKAVHDANMAKVDGRLGPIVMRADGQIGKPPGWLGPEDRLAALLSTVTVE